jgi:hypothetical protein
VLKYFASPIIEIRESGFMQNYSKTGGVLSIIAGAFGVLWLLMIVFGAIFMWILFSDPELFNEVDAPPEEFFMVMIAVYGVIGLFYVAAGVLAIVGGVFALKKKYWGWSLAGAIAGTMTFWLCGIPALVFICLGKSEYDAPQPLAPAPAAQPQTAVQSQQ